MKKIESYEQLQPGDILEAIVNIPRWIGTLFHSAGWYCDVAQRVIVTDVYPSACRVVHPEGGILFICGRQCYCLVRFVDHGKPLSLGEQRQAITDKLKGAWPRYEGQYRTPVKQLGQSVRLNSKTFATIAKRQLGKTSKLTTKR